ncbi:MAG: RHS domain-containing protein [Deltaproteobacteria bacterium]|nr:RHS domain-containing protein [Deltaproteobacteria bacterium]
MTGINYPSERVVSYQIDSAGRISGVSTIKDGITDTVVEEISYLPFGPIEQLVYGNGRGLTQSFDQLYRPERIASDSILDFAYTTDAVGNITAIADNLDDSRSRFFQYDALNRLTHGSGIFGTIDYTYDRVGNRLTRTVDGISDTYQYQPGGNRLSQITGANPRSFSYDFNGNTTGLGNLTCAYNQNDRLIRIEENGAVTAEYTYNGNGQRVKKVSNGKTVIYHYDRFGNLFGESTSGGVFIREYIYLNTMRVAGFATDTAPNEITVTVVTDDGQPLAGLRVYAFTEAGSYTGKHALTDELGRAEFAVSDFSEGSSYRFRADYMSYRFWSDVVTIPAVYSARIEIEKETATLSVIRGGGVQCGVKVYLFNEAGSYLGLHEITDENGQVFFDLPAGVGFKFRADTLGGKYYSDVVELVPGQPNSVVIDIGGGLLSLTVDRGDLMPLCGVKAYLFSESGSYLGLWDRTDDKGKAGFEVSSGRYKIRVDYLGYKFWTGIIDTDLSLAAVLSIPHNDVAITVAGDHNGNVHYLQGLKTYLFTPAGAYLGRYEVTDDQGRVLFNLPEKDYKVRVDYLSQQFWSNVFNSTDAAITIEEAVAEVSVLSAAVPVEGVKTYVFNRSGSYLGLYDRTDSEGKTLFRLPAGDYNFRADYMGNQYFSGLTTLIAHTENPITISTSGGAFTVTVLKAPGQPLVGVKCYLFNESGSYLGKHATTNSSGEVSFDLSDGSYKIRVDCLGYQFWTDVFNIPGPLSITHTVAHHDNTVTVLCNYNGDLMTPENIKAYLFTPGGSYLGQWDITDDRGEATFNLPEKDYKIRADYLGKQFWSDVFNTTDTTIIIEEAVAEIQVLQGISPLSNVKVYVFNESDAYLGLYQVTDTDGKATFRLPAGLYKFRADHQGNQYWANETILAHQLNQITLSTGGGCFKLTVEKSPGIPIAGIKVYVFSTAASYLGMYARTDDTGKVSFDLSDGSYMFRVDYLGYRFFTDVYAIPDSLEDTFSIPHQDITVTVNKVYGTEVQPIENIKVYLFKASGSYVGRYEKTDSSGQVVFNLPEQDYKVRADYLGSRYWSDVIFWQDEDIDIDHGKITVHVTEFTEDIQNAKVYVFSDTGSYLGLYEITDSSGIASFTLPVKAYKLRVDYNSNQYWSDTLTPIAHDEIIIDLELDLLALQLTNDPKPIRLYESPPQRQKLMLASLGPIAGLIMHGVVAQTHETRIYYYLNDHLGSPIKVIDANDTIIWAADYMPFGEVDILINTFENNFRFPGQYYDQETGFHYNYHRYYNPGIGRYLRADPRGILEGSNLYIYCFNSPILFIDPFGLKFSDILPGIRKALIEGVKGATYAVSEAAKSTSEIALHGHPLAQIVLGLAAVNATAPLAGVGAIFSPAVTSAALAAGPYTPVLSDVIRGFFIPGPPPPTPGGYVGMSARQFIVDPILDALNRRTEVKPFDNNCK